MRQKYFQFLFKYVSCIQLYFIKQAAIAKHQGTRWLDKSQSRRRLTIKGHDRNDKVRISDITLQKLGLRKPSWSTKSFLSSYTWRGEQYKLITTLCDKITNAFNKQDLKIVNYITTELWIRAPSNCIHICKGVLYLWRNEVFDTVLVLIKLT